MKNIVNIVNFVRGIEPRPRDIDLKKPVIEQIRIMKENNLRGTFLLQYDTLLDKEFLDIIDTCKDFCEIGLWFEVVQPMVEAIGEKWPGRFPWDWHNNVGFLIAYAPDVRYRLIDEAMRLFKSIYGYYPESVGSWHIDALSMKYLADKYNVVSSCICRDQVGTDGYTMQGGYYNQAYYPSVNNMFCPAQTEKNQINMPVFRMLGSDPIYAYDFQIIDYDIPKCSTLEPVGSYGGGNPDWCDWFFDEIFDGSGLSFQYTQTGQENSFGWPRMGAGIEYQFPLIKELADNGEIEIQTLAESGKWFRETFKTTPPATVKAITDWKHNNKSVWYYNNKYRVNLFSMDGVVRIRDMYLFDENFKEHYIDKCCTTTACEFRNLPVMDGSIYHSADKNAGIYFTDGEKDIKFDNFTYSEKDGEATVILSNDDGHAVVHFGADKIMVNSNFKTLKLVSVYDKEKVYGGDVSAFGNKNNRDTVVSFISKATASDGKLSMTFCDFDYSLNIDKGTLTPEFDIISDNGDITVSL